MPQGHAAVSANITSKLVKPSAQMDSGAMRRHLSLVLCFQSLCLCHAWLHLVILDADKRRRNFAA